jgi:hypothetical protein
MVSPKHGTVSQQHNEGFGPRVERLPPSRQNSLRAAPGYESSRGLASQADDALIFSTLSPISSSSSSGSWTAHTNNTHAPPSLSEARAVPADEAHPHWVFSPSWTDSSSALYEGPHWTKINPSSNITRIQRDHQRSLKIFAVSLRLAVYDKDLQRS